MKRTLDHPTIVISLLLSAIVIFGTIFVPINAFAISSATYGMPQYDVSQGAGSVSSTNYSLQGEISPVIGVVSSASYKLDNGFPATTGGTITLSLDSSAVSLALNAGVPATGTSTITVATNALAGYSVAIQKNQLLTHTNGSTTISDFSGTIGSPAVWSGTGLGFTVTSGTSIESKWSSGTAFGAIPTQSSTVFHTVSSAISAPDATVVTYKLDTLANQLSGSYSTIVSFIGTAAP